MIDLSVRGFSTEWEARADAKESNLCVGLDFAPAHVPPQFGNGLDVRNIWAYAKEVITLLAPYATAIKPQKAYYSGMGPSGQWLLNKVVDYATFMDLLVVLDAKRWDIDSTMEMYGEEVFGWDCVHACTVNAYPGPLTILPTKNSNGWMNWMKKGRGPICMARTSNTDAPELQDLVAHLPDALAERKRGYERKLKNWESELGRELQVFEWDILLLRQLMEEVLNETDGIGSVAAVIGATFPEEATLCRELATDEMIFLVPGYGFQGGTGLDAARSLPKNGRRRSIISSSRGITLDSWFDRKTGQPREGDPMELVLKKIVASRDELEAARQEWMQMNRAA